MGCPLYPVQTSLFPPTAGDVFLKTGFFNLYLHLTNAVKRQISSRYYHFNVITIQSNSSAFKRFVIASNCAEAQSKAKGKQSNTNSHSEPCEKSNLHRVVGELALKESKMSIVNSSRQFCAC